MGRRSTPSCFGAIIMRLPIILMATTALALPAAAADLGVLTALDVCDELGLSGLTVSSDSNCLQISSEL